MKFELRMFREDKQQWAYAEVEIDDLLLDHARLGRSAAIAQELVPYIETMQELK